jgi:hypothetical protein
MPQPPPPESQFAPEATVFGQCRLGLEDFAHAVRHEPRTAQLLRVALGLGALTALAGVLCLSSRHRVLGWSLLGTGIVSFASHQLPDSIAQRWFSKLPAQARLVKYTLGPSGLIVTSELAREVHAWRGLVGFREVPDSFLIWVSTKHFLIVPKRAFSAEDLPRAQALLEREIGAPPEMPGFWLWLGIAVVLAGAALGLWNWLAPR